MSQSPVYRPHDEAAARATLQPLPQLAHRAAQDSAYRAFGFELVSRGDFVSGRIAFADPGSATKGSPLVLLTASVGAPGIFDAGGQGELVSLLLQQGNSVAAIDLPLQGTRSSPKLSDRLEDGVRTLCGGDALDLDTRALVQEFARQSTSDLLRTLDALAHLPEIDASRLALVGIGSGALVTAYALAHDDRLRAGILVGGVATLPDPDFDPTAIMLGRDRKKAALLVLADANGLDVPAAATQGFFEALGEPKSFAALDDLSPSGGPLPSTAAHEILTFLSENLSA